ncbi:DegV family protein [Fundicoccus culcitae]|uniref:DegV family protein n=1 Tax=Fundicoccus culcitae TaxID=2969821 RepID=A0ABY5P2J8_9LACT|nr:DegV family protein [Fundicoccus culcitae]UUX32942.1 DegV family protein [Fundicoccus culcitae]
MKVAIIVDSTSYLSPTLATKPNIFQVNLSVNFADGTTYQDASNPEIISEFYKRLKSEKQLPTTSQPQVGEYYQIMENLVAQHYEAVISIHLASAISGTFQQAQMVLKEFEDRIQTYCIDSKGSSVVLESLVSQTHDLLSKGYSPEVIVEGLLLAVEEAQIYLMVEDLNNLSKGGRLSSTSAFFGNVLQIKPLLYFDQEGKIVLFEKIRSTKKVYQRWEALIMAYNEAHPKGFVLAFAHAQAEEQVMQVLNKTKSKLGPEVSFLVGSIGPVIGTHIGAGARGMALIPRLETLITPEN